MQAFLDCELSQDEVSRVSGHIATCDACAGTLAEAEEESAFVFSALDREMTSLVPTQRLCNKINDSISDEPSRLPVWQQLWALVSSTFTSPSLAIAASLVIVAGIGALLMFNRAPVSSPVETIAKTTTAPAPVQQTAPDTAIAPAPAGDIADTDIAPRRNDVARQRGDVYEAAYRPEPRRVAPAAAQPVKAGAYMPGEESYVRTIATLSKTVDEKKDGIMGASERVAFEKDLALVNDSINKLRTEVKRNPSNESAKQVLYSSYQNKIELLNSVAQKEELIASLSLR